MSFLYPLSCLVLSCLVLSCLVLSCLVLSCLVLSCLVLSCLALPCLVVSCLVLSRPLSLSRVLVVLSLSESMTPDKTSRQCLVPLLSYPCQEVCPFLGHDTRQNKQTSQKTRRETKQKDNTKKLRKKSISIKKTRQAADRTKDQTTGEPFNEYYQTNKSRSTRKQPRHKA
jgi:hypothetical protein